MRQVKPYLFIISGFILFSLPMGCSGNENLVQTSSKDSLPNIIVFLADDLGYGDLNSYGGIPETPHIDRLANGGIKFTDFYAPAPNCSPSRAGLLTGRNPNRIGIYSYRMGNSSMHLRTEEITIAEILKEKGYKTAMFGKWHLSDLTPAKSRPLQPTPGDQGFDYWLATETNAKPSHQNPVNFVRNGVPEDTLRGYSSHILAREANNWLEYKTDKRPFFLYIPFHEVHKKIASPDSLIEKYGEFDDAEYHANVENLDAAVGRVIKKLKELGQFENTLILFASDNGSYRHGSNGNLRGFKGESFEGGVRVPGIIHWPEIIKEGREVNTPSGLIDMFPTIAEITGTEIAEDRVIDGQSLLPLIREEKFKRSKPLVWFFYRAYPELGMRAGKYILNGFTRDTVPRMHYLSDSAMVFIKSTRMKDFKMYNIEKDPLQKRDISSRKPLVFDSLRTIARSMFQDIVNEGTYWQKLPSYDQERARPKRKYMRNKDVRWDTKQK